MKKKALMIVLTLVLCFGLLTTPALAADAVNYVEYSWDGVSLSPETKIASGCTEVTSDTAAWAGGWYVVNENVTINGGVSVSGDVHLILTDGSGLTVTGDVSFEAGNSLTVYGQAQGTGALTVTGGMANGSVGHNSNGGNGGNVTVHGGTVNVNGDMAIGGNGSDGGDDKRGAGYDGGCGGSVTVNGGTVVVTGSMASGGSGGSGKYEQKNPIGGSGGSGGSVTVHGGMVAVGGSMASGGAGGDGSSAYSANNSGGCIGGTGGSGGCVTVTDGSVTVTDSVACGGNGGKGGDGKASERTRSASGGSGGNGSTVTVSGGTVTIGGSMASGGSGGSGGFGYYSKSGSGGNGGNGSTVTVSSGTVTVSGSMASGGSGGKGGDGNGGNGKEGGDGGNGGNGGTVTVSGGTTTVNGSLADRGNRGQRGISGYSRGKYGSYGSYGTAVGIIYQNNVGTVYGDVTLEHDLEIPAGATLTVPAGASLTVPAGVNLTVPAGTSLTVNGTLDLSGTVTNNGTLILQDRYSLIGNGAVDASESAVNQILTFTADEIIVPEDLVYNGSDQTDTVKEKICLKQTTVCGAVFTYNTADWTCSFLKDGASAAEVKDAGTYTVIYTKGNASVEKAFYVAKAGFEVSSDALSSSLLSKDIYWGDTVFDFSAEAQTPENITICISGLRATLTTEGVLGNAEFDVDSSNAVISGEGSENYDVTVANTANGYVKVIPLTITGVKMDADAYTYGDAVGYDNTELSIAQPGGNAANAEDLVYSYTGTANDGTFWNSIGAPTKAGSYTLTVRHSDVMHYSGSRSVNFTIARKPIEAPLQAEAVTYNGTAQTYAVTGTADYSVDGGIRIAANEAGYDVTISLNDSDNTCWVGGGLDDLMHRFVINRAPATVTAKNQSYHVGTRLPETIEQGRHYTIEGLMDGDSIGTVTLIFRKDGVDVIPDATQTGYYDIIPVVADANSNYDITFVNGTLSYYYIPTYIPVVPDTEGGDVTIRNSYPAQGQTVTITPKPEEGMMVDTVTVTDSRGNEIEVTKNSNGTYSFKQPAGRVTILVTFKPETCPSEAYSDLDTGAWYHEAVDYVLRKGLMNGVGMDRFDPNGTTSRAMIVTILWRLEGEPVVNYLMQFEDVPAEAWYTEAVRWAASEKIVEGYDGAFNPMGEITREQFATILWRYAGYKGYDVSVGEDTNILSYADALSVSEYAIPAMQWACGSGLMQGDGVNLTPKADATRVQAAALFRRFCENAAEQ